MNRCKVSLWILLSLILLCILSLISLQQESNAYLHQTERLEQAVSAGDSAQIFQEYTDLMQDWKNYQHHASIFINSRELEEIQNILFTLPSLLQDSPTEAQAELVRMKKLIFCLYEEELPVIWHIL